MYFILLKAKEKNKPLFLSSQIFTNAMKTYIIHVQSAVDRKIHIEKQLEGKNLDYSYILEGDKSDLSKAVLDKYFTGIMHKVRSATSCTYKHLLAYQRFLESEDHIALILEDDIAFYSNFDRIYEILKEIETEKLENLIVSVEDSMLKYIPRSERKKGKILYPREQGRLAGAYLIDRKCAGNLISFVEKEKAKLPIDWLHIECVEKKIINMYWSKYAIGIQGSLDGSILSLIDDKKHGIIRVFIFKLQRLYKKLIYELR